MLRHHACLALLVASTLALGCHPRETSRRETPTPPERAATITPVTSLPPPSAPAETDQPVPPTLRDVGVSDVVRVEGTTLYYADSTAGLTVVDVADASQPRVLGVLSFVGTPLALFVREGTAWVVFVDWDSRFGTGASTVIRAIDVRDPREPRLIGDLAREGAARDAKLVGGYLFVLRRHASGAVVESFAVRTGAVQSLDAVRLEGLPAQLAASPAGLAAVTVEGDQARVSWLDLPMDRRGGLELRDTVVVPGGVARWEHADTTIVDADEDQIVRLVTCATPSCGPGGAATLRIVDIRGAATGAASSTEPVTSLRVTERGGLPITKFADGRLYVAEPAASGSDTTLLHVIRTDTPKPRLAATVALRGDVSALVSHDAGSLVALGTSGATDSQVKIVLHDIDVEHPAAPRLRGSAVFGSDWTWTVGLDDESALSFDPSSHLVAIPFTAWRYQDKRFVTGTQVVDLRRPRPNVGTFASAGSVERAVFIGGRLVTIGPAGLGTIDYASTLRLGEERTSGE
jgi:hypothetical protein